MEISKTKNYQMFDALHDACVAKKDTFLGILTNEKSESTAVQFCGNPKLLGNSVEELFEAAFTDKDNEANIVIANAILNGICHVIANGGSTGVHMMHVLIKVILTSIGDNIGEDLFDDECKCCDKQYECIMDSIVKYLENNIPMPEKKPARRKNNKKK